MMNKSLISVKGRFLFYLVIILTALIIIAGCSDDDENIVNPPPSDNAFKLTGTITNYPGGSTIAKAPIVIYTSQDTFFVGTDTIENNGSLNMLLTTPPTNFLFSAKDIVSSSNIVVSDTTASYTGFTIINVFNFSNIPIAMLLKKNFAGLTLEQGSFYIQYIFATKPFTVMGENTSFYQSDTTIIKYNLNFKEGWNIMNVKLAILRNNSEQLELTMGEPTGATWQYETVSLTKVNPNFLISQRHQTIFDNIINNYSINTNMRKK